MFSTDPETKIRREIRRQKKKDAGRTWNLVLLRILKGIPPKVMGIAATVVILTALFVYSEPWKLISGGAENGPNGPDPDSTITMPSLVVASEMLLPVIQNGVLGYANRQGQIVIEPQYNYRWMLDDNGRLQWTSAMFSEGFVAVNQGNQWRYIDSTGTFVFDRPFDRAYNFSEGLAVVRSGNKRGYIDTSGNTAIPFDYDGAFRFSEGLAKVVVGGEYGYINRAGGWQIRPRYKLSFGFSDDRAIVRLGSDGRERGFIDRNGNIIARGYANAWRFSEGLAPVQKSNSKWVFINKQGSTVISQEYDLANTFHEGLAYVKRGRWFGFVDRNGQEVIRPQYEDAGNFSEGLAWVKAGATHGYIDKQGQWKIPPQFDRAYDFYRGVALVEKDGLYGYVDTQGNYVWEPTR